MINVTTSNKRGSSWNPSDEWNSSIMRLWLDPTLIDGVTGNSQDYITLNGSNISQIDDRSGNNNHYDQNNSTSQPFTSTSFFNGNRVIRGYGNDKYSSDKMAGSVDLGIGSGTMTGFTVIVAFAKRGSYGTGRLFSFGRGVADNFLD